MTETTTSTAVPVAELPQILNVDQLAAFLDVSPVTLERWRATGEGPRYFKTTSGKRGRVRYRLQAVLAWIEEQEAA